MRKYTVVTAVWGERYCVDWINNCLPSWLAKKNIPYLKKKGYEIDFVLLCDMEAKKAFIGTEACQVLKQFCNIIYHDIREFVDFYSPKNVYGAIITRSYYEALKIYPEEEAKLRNFVYLNSDFFLSNNYLSSLDHYVSKGANAVIGYSLRVNKEAVSKLEKKFEKGISKSYGIYNIEPNRLVKLFFEQKHPTVEAQFHNSEKSWEVAHQIYFNLNPKAILAYHALRSPVLVRPKYIKKGPTGYFDFNFIFDTCKNSKVEWMSQSTEGLIVEFEEKDKEGEFIKDNGPLSLDDHFKHMKSYANPLHVVNASKPIIISSAIVKESVIKSFIRSKINKSYLEIFRSIKPKNFLYHPFWTYPQINTYKYRKSINERYLPSTVSLLTSNFGYRYLKYPFYLLGLFSIFIRAQYTNNLIEAIKRIYKDKQNKSYNKANVKNNITSNIYDYIHRFVGVISVTGKENFTKIDKKGHIKRFSSLLKSKLGVYGKKILFNIGELPYLIRKIILRGVEKFDRDLFIQYNFFDYKWHAIRSKRYNKTHIKISHKNNISAEVCIPVWGEQYIDCFLENSLPSILQSRRLDALTKIKLHIYSNTEGIKKIKSKVKNLVVPVQMKIIFKDISDYPELVQHEQKYYLKSSIYKQFLKTCPSDSYIFLLNADIILNYTFISDAIEILNNGFKTIEVICPRVIKEQFDNLPIKSISSEELAQFAIKNIHPASRYHDATHHEVNPSHIYWFSKNHRSMIAKVFHYYPIAIRSLNGLNFEGTIDDDFVFSNTIIEDERYIPTKSNILFCCELTTIENKMPFGGFMDTYTFVHNINTYLYKSCASKMRSYLINNFRNTAVFGEPILTANINELYAYQLLENQIRGSMTAGN